MYVGMQHLMLNKELAMNIGWSLREIKSQKPRL